MFKFFHKTNSNILILLLSAFMLRLFLANFGTLELDHGTFVAWAGSLSQNEFKTFYSGWSDYLPGYLYILYLLGKLNSVLPSLQSLTFKLPAIVADVLTGYLIYRIVKNKKVPPIGEASEKWGLGLAAAYIFNPAIIANSTLWGQVDSLTALFSVFSVYIFKTNIYLSAITLALGTLIKPQAAFIVPAILYLFIQNKKSVKEVVKYSVLGLLIFALGFLPFTNYANLFPFIWERLNVSATQYPYGSVNAFSFWGIFGFWKPDKVSSWIGIVVTLLGNAVFFLKVKNRKNYEYIIAAFSLLTTFLFMTRMHERHLLPAFVFLLISTVEILPSLISYAGFSFTYLANLAYAYYWITDNFKEIFNPVVAKFMILLNIILGSVFLLSVFDKKFENKINKILNFKLDIRKDKKLFISKDITVPKAKKYLILILLFAVLTRFYGLGNPKNEYFDEVYHVFTAKLMLHNDPKAWEWWNPHPEGFAYEWTHPPIAKLGMVLGMKVLGENSFGSRAVQASLGVGSIYLIYLIVLSLFKDRKMALLASLLLSLEGLFLVMNRIGMNDTYMVFFMLLSYLFFVKEKNLFSAIAFGLSISSKWSAIYFLPILGITHFVLKRKITLKYLWFLVIPPLVYVASYTQMFTTGHTWDQFVEVQRQMWWYHTNLKAEHPYTSPAWSWPLLLRPIYLYNGPEINGSVERIYAFGNPVIFWFGLFSVIIAAVTSWKEKIKKLGLIIFSYLIFFVPWIASPRIMFLYHYLPSVPFLVIISSFVLRRYKKITFPFFVATILLFIYFYPHWTAIKIPEVLDKSYYWFSSWR